MPACVIPCCDVWSWGTLLKNKMQAYKLLEAKGRVARLTITFDKLSKKTVIEYMASLPHEWILQDLKQEAADLLLNTETEQGGSRMTDREDVLNE